VVHVVQVDRGRAIAGYDVHPVADAERAVGGHVERGVFLGRVADRVARPGREPDEPVMATAAGIVFSANPSTPA
jgi:hypothetical protein